MQPFRKGRGLIHQTSPANQFSKMKKVLLGICLSALWLYGCQQDEALIQPDEPSLSVPGVPTVVVQAVKSEYPSATELKFSAIDKDVVWESSFLYQSQTHEAKIDNKGQILEVYAVAGGVVLPTVIQDFITKNYAGYRTVAVSEGKIGTQKSYKVLLKNEKEEITLLFDETGKLLAEFKATPPPAGITPPKTYPIQKVEELPAAAVQYLKDQGLTFGRGLVSVEKDNKKTFTITATKGTTIFTLVFDEAGKLLKSSSVTPPPAPQELLGQIPHRGHRQRPQPHAGRTRRQVSGNPGACEEAAGRRRGRNLRQRPDLVRERLRARSTRG